MAKKGITAVLDGLQEDTADYWVGHEVPVLENCSVAEFMREGLSRYHPVILKGFMDNWPAMSWSEASIKERMGDLMVSVNLTPDGRADSVQSVEINGMTSERFVYPAEVQMTTADFFTLLHHNDDIVPYLSQQNDCMRSEFGPLLPDIPPSVELMDIALNNTPEAINLWIGDQRSVSSLHKDHFENMYAVISGEKVFTLFPPTDVAFIPTDTFLTAKYTVKRMTAMNSASEDQWQLNLTSEGCPSEELEWIPIDPNDREDAIRAHPKFARTKPLYCSVQAGEILYIPAMWYHRVSQTRMTIAVNYWYDMRFDFR